MVEYQDKGELSVVKVRMVYKFNVPLSGEIEQFPLGGKIISVGQQFGRIAVWAEVDPDARLTTKEVVVVGTGWPMPDCVGKFLGTVFNDEYVWHLYEKKDEEVSDE